MYFVHARLSDLTVLQSIKKPGASAKVASEGTDDVDVGVNERGERFVDLGKKKRATVTTFKGTSSVVPPSKNLNGATGGVYLDVREFWGDEGDLKPGKKGVMLNQEQVCLTAAHV